MTLRHLQIFVAVAEEKTMHAAAKKLYISQPSVSQAIAELENHYDVLLFERISKRLFITDAGKALLPYAKHVLGSFCDLEQMMTEQSNKHVLKIGASVSVGTCMINDVIEKLKESAPKLEIQVQINNTSEIERMLLDTEIDCGIVEGVIESKDLICKTLCEDDLIIIASPDHPLARQDAVSVSDLAGQDFIAREAGSNDRNQFEQLLQHAGIPVNRKWVSTNTQAIIMGVAHNNGLAIMSRLLSADGLRSGIIRELPMPDTHISRSFKLVYHKNKYISDKLQSFFSVCDQLYQ
ncbi:MAG: LysR family transcriptional regulator [Lachnospiraceae bacterium]|nr:LysR family transcriptional regulator [Lachnospiraceae bacterium]